MRHLPHTIAAFTAVVVLAAACSSKGEQAAAVETAQQIEEARLEGRNAARAFIFSKWNDTIELQHRLVEAGSRRARFDSLPQSRAAFDSAFISTVRTVDASVAEEIQRHAPK